MPSRVSNTDSIRKKSSAQSSAKRSQVSPDKAASSRVEKTSVKADVLDLSGKVVGSVSLPGMMFGATINKPLLAQAVRVHLANNRQGTSRTKTRGEVRGSTRKIYRQKGTGRARHGGITAPIFVGGGVAFGPKPRDFDLGFPKKMRRQALFSALSLKFTDKAIAVVAGLNELAPKTKSAAKAFSDLSLPTDKGTVLVVTSNESGNIKKAARNLKNVSLMSAETLNSYDTLNATKLVLMREAVDILTAHFVKGSK